MSLTEVIEVIPKVIFYLASGFIFIHTFIFFAFKEPLSEDVQGKITLSFVIGFTIKHILSIIPIRVCFALNYIVFLIVSFVLGFVAAKLLQFKCFNSLLTRLSGGRTVNKNFWDDVVDNGMFIKVVNYSEDYSIIGLCSKVEEFERIPQIVLEHYKIENLNGESIEDHTNKKTDVIVVNLEKYDNVHIVYDESSEYCSKIIIAESNEECNERVQ